MISIYSKMPQDHTLFSVPSYRAFMGRERLQHAAKLIGWPQTIEWAKNCDYILEDKLSHHLKMNGIDETGLSYLSAKQWLKQLDMKEEPLTLEEYRIKWLNEGITLSGILLSAQDADELKKILRLSMEKIISPWDLVDIADHLFFSKQRYLNLLSKTRKRV